MLVRPLSVLLIVLPLGATQSLQATAEQIELLDLADVKLLDGPFLHACQLNRDQLLTYYPDRLLAPFLEEAGLEPKAPRYPNWESMGLAGHTAGHYLSALANTADALDDQECRERLDYMISELARAQDANGNGYVGGIPRSKELWEGVTRGEPASADGFSLGNRWVPFYNLHKTYAGLRDAYLVGGNNQAKEVLVKLTDWISKLAENLSDNQLQTILNTEHGGMNEVLADVAAITGDDKYLRLAERFSHRVILDPLAAGEDRLNGLHANTQVPKVIGFEQIASLGGPQKYHEAALFFWDRVVNQRSIAIGGNSISEHFPSSEQSFGWIENREGPETCNTYNMLRLTEKLFESDPAARFADFYERALWNHILSTQHPEHGGYVYFTPARPRHYRVYSHVGQAFWCCVGTGMENHTKYGQFIYAHGDTDLYVNLFLASRLTWQEQGLELTQETNFPDESQTQLTFKLDQPRKLTLKLRHPWWISREVLSISINGEEYPNNSKPTSYVAIDREWHDGDRVEVSLPMHTTVQSLPYLDDYVAFLHGPIVLAAETGTENLAGLVAGEGRMDHVATGPLESLDDAPMLVADRAELPAIVKPVPGESLTFTLADAIRPDKYNSLRLIPFFRLHDARYMLYWRLVSPDKYEQVLADMKQAEEVRLALDRATVDSVSPGEQQPEAEHNFRGERTSTGVWQDRHFRHAEEWFSYDLQAGDSRDLKLRVTYFGSDRRKFDIKINDELLTDVDLEAPKPGEFVDVDYDIPREFIESAADGKLTVKFSAKPDSTAGGIFDVRLLKEMK